MGNVEEWTRRRDGGSADFHGNLKGRYWADPARYDSNFLEKADVGLERMEQLARQMISKIESR